MKSIVEILNINESTGKFDVQTFIEQFKYILGWDLVDDQQRKVYRDYFGKQMGAFFEPIYIQYDIAKYNNNKELMQKMSDSKKLCDEIYKQLDKDYNDMKDM